MWEPGVIVMLLLRVLLAVRLAVSGSSAVDRVLDHRVESFVHASHAHVASCRAV